MPPEADAEVSPAGASPEPGPVKQRLAWLLVALPLAFLFSCAWLGIDFGRHWDQGHRVKDIQEAYFEETLLPHEYNYPSMTFWTTVVASLPEASKYVDLEEGRTHFEGPFQRYLNSNEFQVRCRLLIVVLTSLVVLWTFAASMAWRKRPLEALFAAFAIGASFEVVYHTRWVAPDALMMQFAALCLLACICSRFSERTGTWLKLAAIAAGLVAGTKYTGGILLLPVLIVTWAGAPGLWPLVRAVLLFGLTFLFTTPGAVLEPGKFISALAFEMSHYADGHSGFTVGPGMDHFTRTLRYLLLHGPSQHSGISALMSILGFLGLLGLWRDSRVLASAFALTVIAYIAYISSQSVMFVRNLLLLIPIFALLSARGFGMVLDASPRGPKRTLALSLAAVVVSWNVVFNFGAADTIRNPDLARRFMDYVDGVSPSSLQLSPNVQAILRKAEMPLPGGLATGPGPDVEWLAFTPNEIRTLGYWPSNDPDQFEWVIGPLSANYDYYASWWAKRIVVMDIEEAYRLAKEHPNPGVNRIFPDLVPIHPPNKEQPKGKQSRRAKGPAQQGAAKAPRKNPAAGGQPNSAPPVSNNPSSPAGSEGSTPPK